MTQSNGWPVVPLGKLLTRNESVITIDPSGEYKEVTIRLWGKGVVLRRLAAGSEIAAERRLLVRANHFILSRIDARNGAMGLVPPELDGAVVSNDFPSYETDSSATLPEFLGWLSKTRGFVDACRTASEGTTNRVRLQEIKFLKLEIPLPPLSEQRRIVAKIERLAAKIDEAHQIREQPAIQAKHIASRAAAASFGRVSCQHLPLSDVLAEKSRNGLSARPSESLPGLPILRISAGTSRPDATVDESDIKYLNISIDEAEEYRLRPGDLLACRFNGNLHFVGRFSLFTGESGEMRLHPDKLIRFRVDRKRALPEYVRLVMNSSIGRSAIEAFCQTTAGNIGISAKNLNTVAIPVPPLTEQRRIVAYLDGLQAKVDELKRLQAETVAELDALLPAILDRAFKGEL